MNRKKTEDRAYTAGWRLLTKWTGLSRLVSTTRDFVDTHNVTEATDNNSATVPVVASESELERYTSVSCALPIVPDLPMEDVAIRRIVEEFVERLHDDISQLQRLTNAHNYEAIAVIGHRLKGSAGTLGFPDFYEPSAKLEIAARERDTSQVGVYVTAMANLAARILIPPIATLTSNIESQ